MCDKWELSNSCVQWQTHRSRLIWKYHPSSLCMFGKFYFLFSENYSGAISQFLIKYLVLCIKHLSWVIITGLLRAQRKTNCDPVLIYFSDLVGNYDEVNKEMVEEMCQNFRGQLSGSKNPMIKDQQKFSFVLEAVAARRHGPKISFAH